MTKDSDQGARGKAHDHLRKIFRNALTGAAAVTLGGACESCHPMVCDPLPPPICDSSPKTQDFQSQGKSQWSAVWQAVDGGTMGVAVTLDLYGDGEAIVFKADPSFNGATLVGTPVRTDTKLTFVFAPDAGVSKVEVNVAIDCATRPEALKLGFDVTAPAAGKTVTISSLE